MSFTIKALGQLLRSSWSRPKPNVVRIPDGSVKLFEQTPPAWARWALVLVSVDVMVATSSVEMIWNRWTMPAPPSDEKDEKGLTNGEVPAVEPAERNFLQKLQVIPPGQVLQPEWKRAVSCAFFFVSGITVAAAILAARSRIVRGVSYVRASEKPIREPPQIMVETASSPRKFGNKFYLTECSLLPATEDQMMIETRGQGKWVLDMRGSRIAGQKAPMNKVLARSTMLRTWKNIQGSVTPAPKPKSKGL